MSSKVEKAKKDKTGSSTRALTLIAPPSSPSSWHFGSYILRIVSSQLASDSGFDKITLNAASLLTEIACRTLSRIAEESGEFAAAQGRTDINVIDVGLALRDVFGMSLDDVRMYAIPSEAEVETESGAGGDPAQGKDEDGENDEGGDRNGKENEVDGGGKGKSSFLKNQAHQLEKLAIANPGSFPANVDRTFPLPFFLPFSIFLPMPNISCV
jgi:histone H3/H4